MGTIRTVPYASNHRIAGATTTGIGRKAPGFILLPSFQTQTLTTITCSEE